jgi:hypothetical protein
MKVTRAGQIRSMKVGCKSAWLLDFAAALSVRLVKIGSTGGSMLRSPYLRWMTKRLLYVAKEAPKPYD